MAIERALRAVTFILILTGLAGMSAWAINASGANYLLQIACIALSWGVILLALYITFKKLDWGWWS
jgi:hypothetical protein